LILRDPSRIRVISLARDLAGLGVGSSLMLQAAAQGSHGAGQPHENAARLPVQPNRWMVPNGTKRVKSTDYAHGSAAAMIGANE
jgi:hypothetical protein